MIGLALSPTFDRLVPWLVAGLIVLVGLGFYGLRDWMRFSFTRAWSISGVVFTESMRRRVWLVVLVAIPGIIIVSQFQNPLDEQDAIRQTTKICLFACGIVVVSTAIILSCTNLPREIENRVIFTVVTKPTTRLEIVLGKIMGFARVSALILLVMGIFTYGYLKVRATRMLAFIDNQLSSDTTDANKKASLEYYKEAGLLAARVYEMPSDLQFFAHTPAPNDKTRSMVGTEGSFVVQFVVPAADLFVEGQEDTVADMSIDVSIGARPLNGKEVEPTAAAGPTTLPWLIQNPDATLDQVTIGGKQAPTSPAIMVEILDPFLHSTMEGAYVGGGKMTPVADVTGEHPTSVRLSAEGVKKLVGPPGRGGKRNFFIQVSGATREEYFAGDTPIVLRTADNRVIQPFVDAAGKMAKPLFRGRAGTAGQQLRGDENVEQAPVAVFRYRDANIKPTDGLVTLETNVSIEREDADTDVERPTRLQIAVRDRATGAVSAPAEVFPETRRTAYFHVPASSIPGKDFELIVKCLTKGHFVSFALPSLRVVSSDESFAWSLAKSLFVLWLLTLLVVIVAVFASTFVSGPSPS